MSLTITEKVGIVIRQSHGPTSAGTSYDAADLQNPQASTANGTVGIVEALARRKPQALPAFTVAAASCDNMPENGHVTSGCDGLRPGGGCELAIWIEQNVTFVNHG